MTLGHNPFNPSRALPALATPAEFGTEGEPYVPEELRFTQHQEEQQQNDELQKLYAGEESDPSDVLPPRSSPPPPPALAGAAFHGMAGLVVSPLAPHPVADPAAVLLQFLAAFGNPVGPAPHCRVGATRREDGPQSSGPK